MKITYSPDADVLVIQLGEGKLSVKTGEFPPRLQNLVRLGELAGVDFSENERKLSERLSLYSLQSRYPPEVRDLAKKVSRPIAAAQLRQSSHERGEADEWSDVDLAIISPDFACMSHQKIMDLLVEVALAVDPSVEVRPYTPSDLKETRATNFIDHILAKGWPVYKNGEFLV